MPKIGIEVEGRLRGVHTLFVSADDVSTAEKYGHVIAILKKYKLSHIYISDRENILNYLNVGLDFNDILVTLDVTKIKPEPRPKNLTIMLTLPYELWDNVKNLVGDDQVKFHSEAREVLCVSARHLAYTHPTEFAGDIEV